MADLLKLARKSSSVTTTIGEADSYSSKPPAGAKIVRQTIRTETEKIENGYLITKHYDGRYKDKGEKGDNDHYFSYCEKWYSEEDPLTITLNDKALAEAFDDEGLIDE